jgi:DNA-directed RNA polymerase subunit RPC12/RpoP
MSTLDRTPDGDTYKCDECSRPFKGEAWMDWCAECHAKMEAKSPLQALWACLTCSSTFEAGRMRSGPVGLLCPNCNSYDLSPAHGERELEEYHGEIGTKN